MTLDECEEIFGQALSSTTEQEFRDTIEPLFKEYPFVIRKFFQGGILWRARLIENEKVYSNISELCYPSPECAKQGRLNDKGESCFYISGYEGTALAEIGAEEGQRVQLAGFKINNAGAPLCLVFIGDYDNTQKGGVNDWYKFDSKIVDGLNSIPHKKGQTLIYIDKFFASILGGDKHTFSRALAKAIYSKESTLEGITYPSTKDPGGFNIGVKPSPSDKSFLNVYCRVVQVTKKRCFGAIDFKIIKSAESLDDDGNFIWSKTVPEIITPYPKKGANHVFSQEEIVNYECARDAIGNLIGIYMSQKYAEEKKEFPDQAVIDDLREEVSRLWRERSDLIIPERAKIARIRRTYGLIVKGLMAEEKQKKEL